MGGWSDCKEAGFRGLNELLQLNYGDWASGKVVFLVIQNGRLRIIEMG